MKPKTCTCPKCGYEWEPRKANPKSCPNCKQYLHRTGVKGVRKEGSNE